MYIKYLTASFFIGQFDFTYCINLILANTRPTSESVLVPADYCV